MARLLLPNGLAITTTTSQKDNSFWAQRSPAQGPQLDPGTLRLHLAPFSGSLFSMSLCPALRDSVYDMLRRVCTHLQVWSLGRAEATGLLRPGLRSWDLVVGGGRPIPWAQGTGAGSDKAELSESEAESVGWVSLPSALVSRRPSGPACPTCSPPPPAWCRQSRAHVAG